MTEPSKNRVVDGTRARRYAPSRLSFRAQGIFAFSLLALLVVAIATALHLSAIAEFAIQSMVDDAKQLAGQAQVQVSRAIASRPDLPAEQVIREDPGIAALLESSVGFFDYVKYVAVVDPEGRAVVHSTPTMVGEVLPRKADASELGHQSFVTKFKTLQSNRDFEVVLPLIQGARRLGAIRVGVATHFVRSGLTDAVRRSLVLAGLALLLAVFMSAILANLIASRLSGLTAGFERVGRGDFEHRFDEIASEDFGQLFSSFNTMSQQLQQDRSQMQNQSQQLGALVDAFEDGVVMVNRDGQVILVNPSASRVLGREEAELVGRPLSTTLGPNHPLSELWREAVQETDARERLEVRLDSDARGDRYFVAAYPISDGRRQINGVMLTLRNTDSLRQLASLVDESHRMIAWGQVALGVAHEIKNPLNAMNIHLSLAKDKIAGPNGVGGGKGVSEHLDTIGAQIRRMDEVVNGLLRFARMNEVTLERLDLNGLLREIVDLVANEAEQVGVGIRLTPRSDLPEVWGDRDLLYQVFLNLVQNACQAGPHSGPIEISFEPKEKRGVIVEVRDRGRGIPSEQLGRVFDLFYTTREDGSGIGLAIVRRVIDLHGGEIQIQSQPGEGTLVRVWLRPNVRLDIPGASGGRSTPQAAEVA